MGVLHNEFICRDKRYQHPRLSIPKEDDDTLTVSDIAVVSDFVVSLDDGSRDFSLDIMGLIRPLKDYSFSRPPNLAEDKSDIRERRLEDEKKQRNSCRAKLKDAATKVEKRDNPKLGKSEAGLFGKVPPTSLS
jgi:hypothetical protein